LGSTISTSLSPFLDLMTYITKHTIILRDPREITVASPAISRTLRRPSPELSLGEPDGDGNGIADDEREISIPVAVGDDVDIDVILVLDFENGAGEDDEADIAPASLSEMINIGAQTSPVPLPSTSPSTVFFPCST
jgi:hypothetical protein